MTMTSVRLSVTLVDCDHIVQQKVEISKWQDRSVSWLPAWQSRPGSCIAIPILTETRGLWENGGVLHFGGNNLCVQRLLCGAITASVDHLVSIRSSNVGNNTIGSVSK